MKVVDTTPKVEKTYTISCSHEELALLRIALSQAISSMKYGYSKIATICGRTHEEFEEAFHSLNTVSK